MNFIVNNNAPIPNSSCVDIIFFSKFFIFNMSYKNIIAQNIFLDIPLLLIKDFIIVKIEVLIFKPFWDIFTYIDLFPLILKEEFIIFINILCILTSFGTEQNKGFIE